MHVEVNATTPTPTWLVSCAGRPTQNSVHASASEAALAARRVAEQWPGHIVTVYQSTTSYVGDRPALGARPAGPSAPPGTQRY